MKRYRPEQIVEKLRQRCGIAMTTHPEVKDTATELRTRTRKMLRNPTPTKPLSTERPDS